MLLPKSQVLELAIANRDHKNSNVAWSSPISQDIYGPGDTILAKWSFPETINSPSFKFCTSSNSSVRRDRGSSSDLNNCGVAISPTVMESAGVYQASLPVVEISSTGEYYLQMEDSAGNRMRSPVFTLSPVGASSASGSPISSQPPPGVIPQAQAPLAPPAASITSPSIPDTPAAVSTNDKASSALSHASTAIPPDPNILAAKAPTPTAAYAVPLSAVALVVLVTAGLFFGRRRKGKPRRGKDFEDKPSRSGTIHSYKSYSSRGSEVNHAPHVLSYHHESTSQPVPMFMPMHQHRKERTPCPPPAFHYVTPQETHASSTRHCVERPRLPPIAVASSSTSTSDPATHAVLTDYMLPSPTLSMSTSAPRCLIPSPKKLLLRDGAVRTHPLGTPPADRYQNERDLYAQVESKLAMYRRS